MAGAYLGMPTSTSDTLGNGILTVDHVSIEPEANAEDNVGMPGITARNGSSSPLSNGFSSQLSEVQGMEEIIDDDDDQDASGEDDDQEPAKPPIRSALNGAQDDGTEDPEGEVDDDATSSTVPLTPEAPTPDADPEPEADGDAEDDAEKNLLSAQKFNNPMPKDRVGSGSELTSDDEDEDEDGEEDEEDGNVSERDGDDISADEGSDGDVVDQRRNSRPNTDDEFEQETPRTTASPTTQSIPLPSTTKTSPPTPNHPLKPRKPSIMASSFAPPTVDSDAERLAGVEEEDDESDLSDNESDAEKNKEKSSKGANASKQVALGDDDDDELSEVEDDDGKEDEVEGDAAIAIRHLSASKGKSGEASGVDGNGDNSDMDEDEAPNGERSGSPSPSKASGIATPPPAGTNAPSYHLRGDPFNQSIAPTAPTAEALGALVGIEVKFAQLRDQLYVERMNEFAQEEAVVLKGEHPSVRYLHNILEGRKDNLLRIAELRLKATELEINRVRVGDRKAVMSWWINARETLYTEHYEQNARKKRKIEKDKLELDVGKPAIPVMPKPLPSKDPLVAEPIMRGYDWTRGPVIAGGLPGSEANEDLARMGLRRPPVIYQQLQQPQHQYGMAPQPQMVYMDAPSSRQVAQNQMGGASNINDDAVLIDNPNGIIYASMGRVANGHHHHHHHHAGPPPAASSSVSTVPAPAAPHGQPSHGGVPILGRPRYGHAATGVHINPPAAPRREGRTVPTSTLDPFDPSRRRERDREDYGSSSGKSRRMETNGGSMHEVDEAAAKRRKLADGMGNGSGSRHYGQYGSGGDYGPSSGGSGSRSMIEAKVSQDPTRRSESSSRPKSQHPSNNMANGPSYVSSLSNGPVSSFGVGGQPSRWPFGLYSGGSSSAPTASGGAGTPGSNALNGMRMADPVGGRSGRMLGSLGGAMRE